MLQDLRRSYCQRLRRWAAFQIPHIFDRRVQSRRLHYLASSSSYERSNTFLWSCDIRCAWNHIHRELSLEVIPMGNSHSQFPGQDGALGGHNNPAKLAIDESRDIWPNRQLGCLLSVGTGKLDVVSVSGNLASIAEACAKLQTSCEAIDNEIYKEFTRSGNPPLYFRFSVDRGLGSILLNEWEKEQEITAITEAYLNLNFQADQASRCVRALAMIDSEMAPKDGPAQAMQSMYKVVHYLTGFEPFSFIVRREVAAKRGQTYHLVFCLKISSFIFRSQHSMTSLHFTLLTSSPEKLYFPASRNLFNPPL